MTTEVEGAENLTLNGQLIFISAKVKVELVEYTRAVDDGFHIQNPEEKSI